MAVVQQWDLSLLATLGGALGDTTRFAMFEHVVTSAEPVSAGETAAVFGLHRTVARSHLEKLAEAGLVTIGTRRNPRGGRPAKVYSAASTRLDIQVPPRRYRSLATMLVQLAAKLNGSSVSLAEEVGLDCGRRAATDLPGGQFARDGRLNLDGVVSYLRATACSPQAILRDDHTLAIEVGNCCYLEVARDHPAVVCALCSGFLCGLVGVGGPAHRQTASIVDGDAACEHEFALPA
jgi:predicted ArsR family transcriptional regulator